MCVKAFLYNVKNTGCQPGIERSCKIAHFPNRAWQDNCNHNQNKQKKKIE